MSNYLNETTSDAPVRSDDPEVIRRDIDATRAGLSRDVDALTEKIRPGRIVDRKMQSVKGGLGSVRERVMGSPGGGAGHAAGAVGAVGDKASSVASSVGDVAGAAPSVVLQKTEGNPLAAGLIAFGVGWLASSLIPATEKEQRAATAVKEQASEHADTLTNPVKEAVDQARGPLQESAQEAVAAVKDKATDAANTVKAETVTAKDDVAGSAHPAPGDPRSGSI
jgi:hypothetical protein